MKSFYRQIVSLALIASVAVFSPVVRAATAESADPEFVSTRLEVDLEALEHTDAEKKLMLGLLRNQIGESLHDGSGVPLADEGADATIVVKLSWVDMDGLHYAVKVTVVRDGEPDSVTEFECKGCSDAELGRVVGSHLPEIVPNLERKTEPAPPQLEGDPPQPEEVEVEPDPEPEKPKPRPLGPLGKAGIGVGVVGLLGIGAGALVFVQGQKFDNPMGVFVDPEGKDYRDPGVGVMVAGGLMVVGGLVLFVIDRTRGRKGRSARKKTRVGPTSTGAAFAVKF